MAASVTGTSITSSDSVSAFPSHLETVGASVGYVACKNVREQAAEGIRGGGVQGVCLGATAKHARPS